MRNVQFFVLGCLALLFTSCTELYDVYIRNASTQTAVLDVFLLNKSEMDVLPNRVAVANKVLDFKTKFRKYVDSSQAVTWVDVNHFKIDIQPNTTIDITGLERNFKYSLAGIPAITTVTITANNKTDILIEKGSRFLRFDKFKYVFHGPFSPTNYYYDVSDAKLLEEASRILNFKEK